MFSKVGDGVLPVIEFGRCVREQVLECSDQVCGFGDIEVEYLLSVLIEDGALWGLKQDVVEWVACVAFLVYCFCEVVVDVLCFPVGERESVFVEDRAVNNNTGVCCGAHRVLWDEGAVHLFCAGVEEEGEGVADCAFVSDGVLVVLLQRGVVVSDCFVVRFEVELWHGGMVAGFGGCVNGN